MVVLSIRGNRGTNEQSCPRVIAQQYLSTRRRKYVRSLHLTFLLAWSSTTRCLVIAQATVNVVRKSAPPLGHPYSNESGGVLPETCFRILDRHDKESCRRLSRGARQRACGHRGRKRDGQRRKPDGSHHPSHRHPRGTCQPLASFFHFAMSARTNALFKVQRKSGLTRHMAPAMCMSRC